MALSCFLTYFYIAWKVLSEFNKMSIINGQKNYLYIHLSEISSYSVNSDTVKPAYTTTSIRHLLV